MANKNTVLTLSWIVMIATLLVLIVALGKFGVFTGFATEGTNGTVNLSITEQASLRYTYDSCDFGAGSVNESALYAVAYSNGTTINGTWDASTGCANGLELQNDGDVDLSVAVTSSLTALEFIGGNQATPSIYVASSDVTSVNCTVAGGGSLTTGYEDLSSAVTVCDNLTWFNETGPGASIRLDFELTIPEDATPSTAASTVITATGTAQ